MMTPRLRSTLVAALGLLPTPLFATPLQVSPPVTTEEAKFPNPDPEQQVKSFGYNVAISGDTLLVAHPNEDVGSVPYAGSVLVFVRSGGGWVQEAKLTASNPMSGSNFGWAMDLEGDTALVGSYGADCPGTPGSGVVYVFERTGSTWTEQQLLHASDAQTDSCFGRYLAVDGDTLVISSCIAPTGAAYVFTRSAGVWSEQQKLVANNPLASGGLGGPVSISDGTILSGASFANIGTANAAGMVYVYAFDGVSWSEQQQLKPAFPTTSEHFGADVALQGDSALIGAPHGSLASSPGTVYVFSRSGAVWTETQALQAVDAAANDRFGISVDVDGDTAVVGAYQANYGNVFYSGSAYAFHRQGPSWTGTQQLVASDRRPSDQLGVKIAVSGVRVGIAVPYDDAGWSGDDIDGLAFGAGWLWGVDNWLNWLFTIDASTGEGTGVGPLSFSNIQGLAYHPGADLLYGSDTSLDVLVQIDPATGACTEVGPLGFGEVDGLAFDPVSGTLFGSDTETDQLLSIDLGTGAATAIGGLDSVIRGLAFDPVDGVLYGTDTDLDQLVSINTTNGVGTNIGPLGAKNVRGLALNAGADVLYGTDAKKNVLTEIDQVTGVASTIGSSTIYVYNSGSAYAFELETVVVTYCTAGISASGCQASLSTSGAASASAGSGFELLAAGVEGSKDGLFFFGANGQQANPWGNGTSYQCVVPPVKRGGLQAAVGTAGLCDGSFAQDLNALWCATCPKPLHNPGAGAVVQAQLWYRDPLNTSNQTTSFSDAVEFTVAP